MNGPMAWMYNALIIFLLLLLLFTAITCTYDMYRLNKFKKEAHKNGYPPPQPKPYQPITLNGTDLGDIVAVGLIVSETNNSAESSSGSSE